MHKLVILILKWQPQSVWLPAPSTPMCLSRWDPLEREHPHLRTCSPLGDESHFVGATHKQLHVLYIYMYIFLKLKLVLTVHFLTETGFGRSFSDWNWFWIITHIMGTPTKWHSSPSGLHDLRCGCAYSAEPILSIGEAKTIAQLPEFFFT